MYSNLRSLHKLLPQKRQQKRVLLLKCARMHLSIDTFYPNMEALYNQGSGKCRLVHHLVYKLGEFRLSNRWC